MDKPDWLAVGAAVFAANCVSCHAADGSGLVGPNLTDDYYKNVKKLADICSVVRERRGGRSMPAWRNRLHPNESRARGGLRGQPPRQELPGPAAAGRRDDSALAQSPTGRPTSDQVVPGWSSVSSEAVGQTVCQVSRGTGGDGTKTDCGQNRGDGKVRLQNLRCPSAVDASLSGATGFPVFSYGTGEQWQPKYRTCGSEPHGETGQVSTVAPTPNTQVLSTLRCRVPLALPSFLRHWRSQWHPSTGLAAQNPSGRPAK